MKESGSAFVGCKVVELIDRGVSFPMIVMYPTAAPSSTVMIGPYSINVAFDALPAAGTGSSLVLLSHGSGGSPILYRTLACHLAGNGFVVGMPEHPGNNREDNSLNGTIENLTTRPGHISAALDWFAESEEFRGALRPGRAAIIGHSIGGYTALAVAGGVPTVLPHEVSRGFASTLTRPRDARVGSLVLLAPATVWYRGEGALSGVDVPVLMLFGDRDEFTPHGLHAEIVLRGVFDRAKVRYRLVGNAGHFSFLGPFPPRLTNRGFPPSQDPPGFDRKKFLDELNVEVLNFLNTRRTP